ncbi:antiviral reverse transcriptase Drt2 [Marinomonas fungiae]|uniref:Reverse transcriptase (RNA-dependent DNA polymerase) n=1 Tax=Marinomonas fungiae TaxID=1137284 RepID=A0A0K6ILJ2_9GAMM|nr:antiviral reverse transcriptase Drt2 [Marinomonas fungiae]CUB04177.1 Reverse transcriptase (RNA-dependent DNA polymerase) [Marinomonas fungiae]
MSIESANWYRSRGYLHFDHPVSYDKANSIVRAPDLVAKYSFFPFISYEIQSKKITKDTNGKVKIKTKDRPIAYSAHIDSHIYSYYCEILSNLYENRIRSLGLDKSIIAFRSLDKSNIDFAYEAFQEIKKMGECSAVALDFTKFFDTLDHNLIKESWCNLLGVNHLPKDHYNVYKSITKFSMVKKIELYKLLNISPHNSKKDRVRVCSISDFRNIVRANGLIKPNTHHYGIPQGSPISALLSNIYMLNFDLAMKKYADSYNGKYFRYCDDMLFIVPTEIRDIVAEKAQKEVRKLKVSINTSKTELRTFTYNNNSLTTDKMLQYLGFLFDGENIYLRSSSLARYSERMKRGVRVAKKTRDKYNSIRSKKGLSEKELFKRKLYSRYTHLGKRNFITYGLRAAKIMQSPTIKRQLKPLWNRFHKELSKPEDKKPLTLK